MVRLLGAGLVGGLVLMFWSALFTLVGPADNSPAAARANATITHYRTQLQQVSVPLPFAPSAAHAAPAQAQPTRAPAGPPPLDPVILAKSLAIACAAATFAAMLMAWFGARRPFAERVLFAVLLGAFAGLAASIPAGGWSEFAVHRSALYLGEVLVGWTLAGMVIAVMLNPKQKKAKA